MKNKIKALFHKAIKLLSHLVPKSKKIWIFGAWQGKLYADNSKYMFEYVNSNCKDIKAIWITGSDDVVMQVKDLGYRCYNRGSLKGIWYIMRARVAFETEGNQDIARFLDSKRTRVIQLWHGVAPKKMDWNKNMSIMNKVQKKAYIMHRQSYWMTSSEQNSQTMHNLLDCIPEKMFATGYPRNDIFINETEPSKLKKELDELYPDCKKIIYMPTHRNFGTQGAEFSESDMLTLDKQLKENNIVMIFKPHFHELKNYLHLEQMFTNIILAKDSKYSDVYSYIKDMDLLISDYSSIIYDFTCAKKPIVLFPYDLEKFRTTDAGLFSYFEDIPAGPFCYNWTEVMEQVTGLLKEDFWQEKREICRKTFHPYDDGKNCERVYNTVVNKILK